MSTSPRRHEVYVSLLRVPKRRTSVEFVALDGAMQRVDVFLAESASTHVGPERLSDLLRRAESFVPAAEVGSGLPVFLNLANVLLVRAPYEADAGEQEEHNLPTEHEVDVILSSGSSVRGLVSYLEPPERSRLSDHLNDPRPFLRLIDGTQLLFVNKRHIARVVPVGSGLGAP